MLDKILDGLKARRVLRALKKNLSYQVAAQVVRETMTDKARGLGKYASQEFKEKLTGNIHKEVAEVIFSDNQIMANRERLTNAVVQMAKYLPLVIDPPSESEEDVTGLRGQPGITGELKAHIRKISENDKEIKEFAWGLDNPTDQEINNACLFRYWTAGLSAEVYHMLRISFKDNHPNPEKDWYRPFVAAMCAWEEHQYRKLIGLPDVLSKDGTDGDLEALRYSTYLNMVLDGSKYPNLEWKEAYK